MIVKTPIKEGEDYIAPNTHLSKSSEEIKNLMKKCYGTKKLTSAKEKIEAAELNKLILKMQ